MSIKLKAGLSCVAVSALLMACTPAENTETMAEGGTETAATSEMSGGMAGEKMSGPQTPFSPSEDKMHRGMMQAAGADIQETYALKMIEHHRGAVEMSEVVLRENPDPRLRAMAEKTITDQRREMTELQEWVTANRARGAAVMAAPAQPAG